MAVRKSINWPKHVIPWYDRWHCTSGNRATSCPLYVTSNNKLRKHSRKIVDRCQFTLGPCQLKIYVFFFRRVYYLYSFIAPRPNRQGYSLILWILKTAFSDFLVLPHQVKTRSGGYLGHGGEGIGGKEFDAPLFRSVGRMRTRRGIRCTTERSKQGSVREITWTRSELTAVYWKYLSPAGGAGVRIRQQSLLLYVTVQYSKTSESRPKFLSPNSFSTMGEIIPTTSLYLLWKYQRLGEPDAVFKIQNIREYPRQFGCGAMNE